MGEFLLNSFLLGVGLAMDAFSVSVATGLSEPGMKKNKALGIPAVFGAFQFVMPMIGWLCVHTIAERFAFFQKFIPWIALLLLGYIGTKMLREGIKGGEDKASGVSGMRSLLVLGIATSIDALSVGFAIAEYGTGDALLCSAIVGVTTFVICCLGILLGKKAGRRLTNKATIVGGIILIAIGLEIFAKGVFR